MRTITLDLGWPTEREAGQNGAHGNPRAVAALRRRARGAAGVLMRSELARVPGFRPRGYAVVALTSYRVDADNLVARCKSYLDGAAEVLGVDDFELELLGVFRARRVGKTNRLLLVMTDEMPHAWFELQRLFFETL